MENKDQFPEAGDGSVQDLKLETAVIQREFDSMDDFEHLHHDDSLNQKRNDQIAVVTSTENERVDLLGNNHSNDLQEIINRRVDAYDEFAVNDIRPEDTLLREELETNITEKMEKLPKTHEEKFDIFTDNVGVTNVMSGLNHDLLSQPSVKTVSYDFITAERGPQDMKSETKNKVNDTPKKEDILEKKNKDSYKSVENLRSEDFRDVKEEFESPKEHFQEPLQPVKIASITPTHESATLEFKDASSEKLTEKPKLEEVQVEKIHTDEPEVVTKSKNVNVPKKAENVIEAEVFFCKMGLDTWFNPEKLNPKVESLIYWRDPKKSGPVFGGVLVVLLALTYFSLISVVAYLSLLGLTGTISFRVYKNVVQAVQKTGEGHPFKEFLDVELSLPPEKVKEVSEVVVAHVNASLSALRRLFLVEDLIDSIKFGVFMWTLTYLGSWFNGMTLVILAWVALFTLPKVYETNKTQIDANLDFVKSKLTEVTAKVRAAVPLGKKEEKTE